MNLPQSSDPPPTKCCPFASFFGSRTFKWLIAPLAAAAIVGGVGYKLIAAEGKKVPDQVSGGRWMVHDMSRPKPTVITPGTASTQEQPGTPPSDAVVLFDGKDLSKFTSGGKPAEWKVENGYMEVTAGKGELDTKEAIGDMQLHAEWAAPVPPKGD